MLAKKDEILIAPIGGLEQIGANSTMIGHDKEWIIIDLGVAFYDKYGIEILTPDITFPSHVKEQIQGMFVTHAHEDHIGAIPYLWPQLGCPIYATEFPAVVLRQKFSEYQWKDKVVIKTVETNKPFCVGNNFEVEYIPLAHSVIGSCGIYIKTKNAGNVFYTGDWKVDETPLLGDSIDVNKMEKIGKDGVDCLLCDSTNILSDDDSDTGSETDVRQALQEVFKDNKDKRITVTCFASNLARMETIFHLAKSAGRKIAIIGRSMHKMIDAIGKTKYCSNEFKAGLGSVISDEQAVSAPAHKVVFLCTGSQGEFRSALYRIARGENKLIKFNDKDLIVFSSKIIPGNELGIRDLQNLIVKTGAKLITTECHPKIHVSGHPNRDAVANMYKWTKPKSLMPIHGDPCMLYAHERFARENGISNTIIAESGDVISLKNGGLKKVAHKGAGLDCIDGYSVIPLSSDTIKDRAAMACNGHVSVSFMLSSSNDSLVNAPYISISGIFVNPDTQKTLQTLMYQEITNSVANYGQSSERLKSNVQNSIKRVFAKYTNKKPVVSVHIHMS